MDNILIIPMAGRGDRMKEIGGNVPKPFIEIDKRVKMFEKSISCIDRNTYEKIILCVLKEHLKDNTYFNIVTNFKVKDKKIDIVEIEDVTRGQAETIYKGLENISTPDKGLMIFNSDSYFIDAGFIDYIKRLKNEKVDISLNIFKDVNNKWSFVKIDKKFNVIEIAEKKSISNYALTGFQYYNSVGLYRNLFEELLSQYSLSEKKEELDISSIVDLAIKNKKKITARPVIMFMCYGTPEEYKKYKSNFKYTF